MTDCRRLQQNRISGKLMRCDNADKRTLALPFHIVESFSFGRCLLTPLRTVARKFSGGFLRVVTIGAFSATAIHGGKNPKTQRRR
jgi:hypothetical protein